MATSFSQQVDQNRVIEGEGDHGDSDAIWSGYFIAQVWQSGESSFQFMLKIFSEGLDFSLSRVWLVDLVEEVVVHFFGDVQFAGVVTGGNGLDVPFDISVLEDVAHVVDEDHEEESNEHTHA